MPAELASRPVSMAVCAEHIAFVYLLENRCPGKTSLNHEADISGLLRRVAMIKLKRC